MIEDPLKKRTTPDQIRDRIRVKGAKLVTFMNNPIGKAVVKALEEMFYDTDDLFDADPYVTAYNLGRRDVVAYMKQLQRIAENDSDAT